MPQNEVTRRRFLRAGIAAGGVSLLAACGAPAASPGAGGGEAASAAGGAAASTAAAGGAAGEQVELSILNENWGDIYNELMTVIGDEFTKENPNVALEWNFDPDWQTKLTTLVAANTPPDAVVMRAGPLTTFGAKGTLTDLTPRLAELGLERDDFVTPLYDSSLLDGKLYAIPGGADWWCLFYNKNVLEEAGLDPEKPPTTFDELIKQSEQILVKDGAGDIQRIGYNPASWHFRNWAYIFGGEFYDADAGKITANNPANVEALARMKEYVKLLDIDKLSAFNQRPGMYEAGNPFATKQASFVFDGFWTYEALDEHAPDIDYGIALWPTLKGTPAETANYMTGGWMYSIPAGTADSQAAWDFIRYAFIDQSAKMGVMTLNGTCIKAQFADWERGVSEKIGSDNRMAPYLKLFTETGDAATKFFPAIPVQQYYLDELDRVYDLVIRGQLEPQAALDEVTTNVQAELDKARG